jgi:hypothetical protein
MIEPQGVNMADITMCRGDGCGLKDDCYRYLAKASERQSFFVKPPAKNGSCEYYWKVEKNAK